MLRRALLLLLVPLVLGACGVSARPATTAAPPLVDAPLLGKWASWNRSPAARRAHCAADPKSGLWFLAAPPGRPGTNWSCDLPTGTSLLVVATSMGGAGLPMCSRDYGEQVGVDGSASLDGTPVALRWLGPVADGTGPGRRPATAHTCALTGITAPVPAGYHTLVAQHILGGRVGTVTVDLTAS